jgi:signal transduction histidine kinase
VRADQQVPGSGLGLSIVDDLAQLYGGELAWPIRRSVACELRESLARLSH